MEALKILFTNGKYRDQFMITFLSKMMFQRGLMTSLFARSTIPFSSLE